MFENENMDENLQENYKKPYSKKFIIIIVIIIVLVLVIIISGIIIVIHSKNKDKNEDKNENNQPEIDFEINTVKFNPEIIYMGSHYNYQGDLLVIYKKNSSKNYFVGIFNDKGEILKEVYEFMDGEVNTDYIHRASSFSDGKRVLIGGKILQCSKELKFCEDPKLYELEFPDQLKHMTNLWFLFTEPIINYGGKYIFWSTFDKDMNILNFVGELKFDDKKYVIENIKGLTNYFYDSYDKSSGKYTLPKILRFGPIKQVLEGGKALSIGGFLNYGLRKGIYQYLSEDKISQLTFFEGYDETTAISPDLKLACVMTTRFSDKTSFEIVGLIPTPYSILASYLVSIDILNYSIFNLRKNEKIKGNIGPALVELSKVDQDKNYKGKNLKTSDLWNFNGFISWSPDGTKIMFDEVEKNGDKRRCQIVKLKNYTPTEIKFEDNFKNDIPYAKTIEDTIDLHLNYPINIRVEGKSGHLEIFHNETKCEIQYYNFSEDNEIFYTGNYCYEKKLEDAENSHIFQVNITSDGKKKGNCNYRLWFDSKSMILFDKYIDGNNKSYGKCNYEGKEINVGIYQPEN